MTFKQASSQLSSLSEMMIHGLFLMLEELRQDCLSECINVTLTHGCIHLLIAFAFWNIDEHS